jgi:hypothetical protein
VIGGYKQLLYQLYANDTGIFFNATEDNFRAIMARLLRYERISGAKINLSKSVLVQLDLGPEPGWFQRAGCAIAQDRQQLKYLGYFFGKNFTKQQEIDAILNKLRARLRSSRYRLLSMASLLIVVKYIFSSNRVFI